MSRPHFLEPLVRGSLAKSLCTDRSSAPIATAVEAAFDAASRKRGLLGRNTFAEGGAMIIAPCNGVHTWFMRFPIDIVFARRDGVVVKIKRDVGPWRIALAWRAFAVVELPAGTAARCGLVVGDRFVIATGGTAVQNW